MMLKAFYIIVKISLKQFYGSFTILFSFMSCHKLYISKIILPWEDIETFSINSSQKLPDRYGRQTDKTQAWSLIKIPHNFKTCGKELNGT